MSDNANSSRYGVNARARRATGSPHITRICLTVVVSVFVCAAPAYAQVSELKPSIPASAISTSISNTVPPLEQIDGLRSIRHVKINRQKHTYYDYLLMNGEVWSTESPLTGDDKPRDLRPWEQRSLKNKIAFNVWNYGLVPMAQYATPVVITLFKR